MKKLSIFLLLVCFLFSDKIVLIEQNATDMAYQLELKKYPKFLTEAELENGKKVQFASVKAMMQVYFHQDYFKRHKLLSSNIKKMYVQDYLDGTKIDAKNALYIFGSHIVGPHGDDLIPVKNETNAKLFMLKNGGTKVLSFERLSKGLIRYLDM
jgi:nitrous oxide reductase accessory protein NosL